MKIYKAIFLFFLIFNSCFDNCTKNSTINDDETNIYNKVIENVYSEHKDKLLLLEDSTSTYMDLEYLNELINDKTKSDSLAQNFYCKNEEKYSITKDLFNSINKEKTKLISYKEIYEIFDKGNGWEEFYKRFNNSAGILTLSRIGIAGNSAIIYVGIQSDYLAGVGNLYYYKKINGQWILEDKFFLWIS